MAVAHQDFSRLNGLLLSKTRKRIRGFSQKRIGLSDKNRTLEKSANVVSKAAIKFIKEP
jgi:hypothetical protein